MLQIWRWKIIDIKRRLVGARKFLETAKPETFYIPIDFYDYSDAKENTIGKVIQEFNLFLNSKSRDFSHR